MHRILYSLFLSLYFSSCSSDPKVSSTDVDNEMTLSISGKAHSGEALTLKKVILINSLGQKVDSSTTNSLGEFSIKTKVDTQNIQGLWSVQILEENLQVALSKHDTNGSIYVNMNPLTSYAFQRLAPLKFANPDQFDIKADSLLKRVIGPGFEYRQMIQNQGFAPIGASKPDPIAALLYQISSNAKNQGIDLKTFFDSLTQSNRDLTNSQEFLMQLIAQSKQNRIDTIILRQELERWMGPNLQNRPPLDPLFKTQPPPPSPALLSFALRIQPMLKDAMNTLQAKFFGPPPTNSNGDSAEFFRLEALIQEMPNLWPRLDTLYIETGRILEPLMGDPMRDMRVGQTLHIIGDREGFCLAQIDDITRSQNPVAAVRVCHLVLRNALNQVNLSQWILLGNPTDFIIFSPTQLGSALFLRTKIQENIISLGYNNTLKLKAP